MGNAPITPPQSETKKESNIPISEKESTSKTGAYPSTTIIFGVLISVAVGIAILVLKHRKKSKSTVDNPPTAEAASSSVSQSVSGGDEKTTIPPDTPEHEEISKRFSN